MVYIRFETIKHYKDRQKQRENTVDDKKIIRKFWLETGNLFLKILVRENSNFFRPSKLGAKSPPMQIPLSL